MKTFTVQYSTEAWSPAVSDWLEHMVTVKADTAKEAIAILNTKKQKSDCNPWLILDCWEN